MSKAKDIVSFLVAVVADIEFATNSSLAQNAHYIGSYAPPIKFSLLLGTKVAFRWGRIADDTGWHLKAPRTKPGDVGLAACKMRCQARSTQVRYSGTNCHGPVALAAWRFSFAGKINHFLAEYHKTPLVTRF